MSGPCGQLSSRLGLVANVGLELASAASVRAEDFIVSCRFMDEDCNVSASFQRLFDPYYFNCFTFQPQVLFASRSTRLSGMHSSRLSCMRSTRLSGMRSTRL